jgi:hypothetical protein
MRSNGPCARLRNWAGSGWRAAMRPRATSVNDNVKEQVIRIRIARFTQRAVSRETPD